MSRVASVVLLLGGTILSVTWIVSPAVSAPQSRVPNPQPTSAAATANADLSVEPIRLDATTTAPPSFTAPRRDPFSFRTRQAPVGQPTPPVLLAPVRPPVRLPVLVAIVKDAAKSGETYRAVLSADGADVTIVSAGAAFGAFTIADVRPDVVVLRDTSSGDTFRLALH